MVGTKRFKFDVFSNDVTLANEMESSGQAGRVHVSEATAKYLSEDYILEEAEDYTGLFYFTLFLLILNSFQDLTECKFRERKGGSNHNVSPIKKSHKNRKSSALKTFFVKDRKMEKTQSKEEEVGSEQTLNRGSFKKITLKQVSREEFLKNQLWRSFWLGRQTSSGPVRRVSGGKCATFALFRCRSIIFGIL